MDKLAEERLEICRNCEHFIKLTQQCGDCLCFMPLKVKFSYSECPKGKWSKVDEGTHA